jgi:hypothetical protein
MILNNSLAILEYLGIITYKFLFNGNNENFQKNGVKGDLQ